MDPLGLITACALVLQPTADGLHCKSSDVQISHPLARAGQAKSELRNIASATSNWRTEIAKASQRFKVPEAWITAVMKAESGGHTTLDGLPITSSAGAMGLMQLMPGTYEELRQRYGLGLDSYDPQDNIFAGAAYLRAMYERYGYPHLFGAYNAGPGRFDAYLLVDKPLPSETRAYVEKILPGTSLNAQNTASNSSHSAPITPSNPRGFALSRRLFFMRSASESNEKDTAETVATKPRTTRSEASVFVPLSSDLHKPQK